MPVPDGGKSFDNNCIRIERTTEFDYRQGWNKL